MTKENKKITKVKLKFMDRIILTSVLPETGNMINMILGRTLADKIRPTPKEVSESGMKILDNGSINFSNTNLPLKEIQLEDSEISFLKAQVERLDSENKITFQNLSLCEKIKSL